MTGQPRSTRFSIALSALFLFVTVLLCGTTGVYVMSDRDLHQALSFARVAQEIDLIYPGQVNWDNLFDDAMDGMIGRLDRFSNYHEPSQFGRIREDMSGSYTGIGVSVVQHQRGLLIMSVREDGPAAGAGLLSGDIIVGVDSTQLSGLGIESSTGLLRGPEDTKIQLSIFRPAESDTLQIEVTRRRIEFIRVPYAGFTADSMIYVRLLDFDAGASDAVERVLDSLLNEKGVTPQGIILDLRGNPGGLFNEAYETANLFLDDGQFIVGTKGRSRWNEEKHFSSGEDITGGLPMAVLVDNGSASSSEIAAGALKQLGRAVLVGDTTFGKGLVQGFTRFLDGSALRLTISRYYLEGNVFLNEFDSTLNDTGHGLPPDYVVDFVERESFPRALDYSLLLNRFANLHTDEIVAASDRFSLDDTWVEQFEAFASEEEFDYASPMRRAAESLYNIAQLESRSPATVAAAERLLTEARRQEEDRFAKYGKYIKMRLKQIALERKFGTREAYARAIVPDRDDIRFAAEVLKAKP